MKVKFLLLFIISIIALTIFSTFYLFILAPISLSLMVGLFKEFRRLKANMRFIVFFSQSIITVFLLIFLQFCVLENFEFSVLSFLNLNTIFMVVLVYPFFVYIVSQTKLDKIIGLILLVILVSSSVLILFNGQFRTVINRKYVDDIREEMYSLENMIQADDYLWYYGSVYDIRNSMFNYGLFQIYIIGWYSDQLNKTHHVIVIGVGVAVVPYQTEYGRILIKKLHFNHNINFKTMPSDVKISLIVGSAGNIYIELWYFAFNRQLYSNISVIFNETWTLKEILFFDDNKVSLGNDVFIKREVNVTISDREKVYIANIIPEEIFKRVLVYHVNYNPNFPLSEIFLFYRYEISIGITLAISLCLLMEYWYILKHMVGRLISLLKS